MRGATGLLLFLALAASLHAAPIKLRRGESAWVVAIPQNELEARAVTQLEDYLAKVLGRPVRRIVRVEDGPATASAVFLLRTGRQPLPGKRSLPADSPEAFVLETIPTGSRPIVLAAGATGQGLKRAIHRLIIQSRQEPDGLAIPKMALAEKPWIPQREWSLCPWMPHIVRGVFVNPHADPRLNIWLYSDDQLERYVEMFDRFGFNGCQLLETCYAYGALGSPEAAQDRQRRIARFARRNGQHVSLWVWAATFTGFGWNDPDVTYTPQPGKNAFDDPAVRACFEKYYDHYSRLAPDVDMLIAHFYDPGGLQDRQDVFRYMRLLREKFQAKNPAVTLAIDAWAAGPDYIEELARNGFQDCLLLEMAAPAFDSPSNLQQRHELAGKLGLRLGIWGWYTAEYETDQLASMYVNARLYKDICGRLRAGPFKAHPVTYWSEMEAHHLNNICSMYAAGQLLWNPDRDPDELVDEIAQAIWGPGAGPKVAEALKFIQAMRTGDRWETYWWTDKHHRLGSDVPADDLARAERLIRELRDLRIDASYVPKIPLPYPPQTLIELMLPHLAQIRDYAEFRVQARKIRAAAGTADKPTLKAMLEQAWKPVPDYTTWVGTFGQIERFAQEKTVRELCEEFKIEIEDPAWLCDLEIDRLLQLLRRQQQMHATAYVFDPFRIQEFWWSKAKMAERVRQMTRRGLIEKSGVNEFCLTDWRAFARP